MAPDLPYDREVVPDDSEGPSGGGRFARAGSSPRPDTSSGPSSARPARGRPRWRRTLAGVGLCTVVAVSLAASSVHWAEADDLTDRRKELRAQLAQTRSNLNESSASLRRAALAVDRTESALQTAQAGLAKTRQQLAVATQRDQAAATKLTQAQAALSRAKAAVVVGQQRLNAQDAKAGEIVRNQYQQQTNLLPIALLVESRSTADLSARIQWSSTLFDTAAAELQRLAAVKRQLDAARARATTLERSVAVERSTAARNLRTTKTLEQRAATQSADVARLLSEQRTIEADAADDVATDKRQYAQLEAERNSVEERIAERIAAAKAEAARRAAAEKAAAERRAAEKAAAERRAAARAAAERAAAERERAAARRAAARAADKARAARQAARRAEARAARIRAEREEAQAAAEARRAEARAERAQNRADRAKSAADRARSDARSSKASSRSARQKATARKKSSSAGASASHGFSYPVRANITSPYGMRFHPILKYWKLHDGTDFGASCGTALRAPHSGRVAERYFNAGYGNRLMIDHGEVDGRFVTTGFNHASRYTVRVGERVSEGDVIGYVGSTGYSTGCHLHLMVWLDGKRTNPMAWF